MVENLSGCLLGGAIGDALGAPLEFMSISQIRARFGTSGLTEFTEAYGRKGAITDDTQMTLFTAEGLLRAYSMGMERGICHPPSVVHHAYIRWLLTQGEKSRYQSYYQFPEFPDGWLIKVQELYSRRAPGMACLSSLKSDRMGTIEKPINNSKGCGGVMRIAPVGLIFERPDEAFRIGCEIAAITHGHPSGYLTAGCLAAIIALIISGASLHESLREAVAILLTNRNHEECKAAIDLALSLARNPDPSPKVVEEIGSGWVAEEALAIAIYCSIVANGDFAKGVLLAVNHSGDSDSTGAIMGNILGALLGSRSIPSKWLGGLELREVIEEISQDLVIKFKEDDPSWWEKYPGW
jgi:ADP-ribosylglycohydrolase